MNGESSYTNIDSFLQQLTNLGLYGPDSSTGIQDYYGLSGLQGQQIGDILGSYYGLGESYTTGTEGMFSPLSQNLLKGASITNYSPSIQSAQDSLMTKLTDTYSSPLAKKAYGKGFAGTGARDVYGRRVAGEYRKGITSELTNIFGQKSAAEAGLGDWLQNQIEVIQGLQV